MPKGYITTGLGDMAVITFDGGKTIFFPTYSIKADKKIEPNYTYSFKDIFLKRQKERTSSAYTDTHNFLFYMLRNTSEIFLLGTKEEYLSSPKDKSYYYGGNDHLTFSTSEYTDFSVSNTGTFDYT